MPAGGTGVRGLVGPGASVSRPHLKVGMSRDFWSPRSPGDHLPAADRGARSTLRRVLMVACVVLLTGCRLDLSAEAVVDADGGGTVAIGAGFDAALLDELDALGVDPTAELEAAAASTAGWEAVRRLRDDGGLEVVATREVADVADIGGAFRELSAGLVDADPALLIDIEVTTDDDGGAQVLGTARLQPPATAGIRLDGVEVGPEATELAAIVARSVDAQLRIRFPGAVVDHDGARVEDRTVVWELPPGDAVPVRARAAAPGWWVPLVSTVAGSPVLASAAGVGALVLLLGVGGLWLRSRSRADATA